MQSRNNRKSEDEAKQHSKLATCQKQSAGVTSELVVKFKSFTKYWILHYKRKILLRVSEKEFFDLEAPVCVYKDQLCKFTNLERSRARVYFAQSYAKISVSASYKGQGLFSDISDFSRNVGDITSILRGASLTARNVCDQVSSFTEIVGFSLIQVLLSGASLYENLTPVGVVRFCVDFYRMSVDFNLYKGESLEACAMALSTLYLPPTVLEVIKRMQLLSSGKVLEDTTWINQILELLAEFIKIVCETLNKVLPERFQCILTVITNWTSKRLIISELKQLISNTNPRSVANPFYRDSVKRLWARWKNSAELVDWARKSAYVKSLEDELTSLYKGVFAFENNTRSEPVMIVLDGPPGTMKSTTMNLLLEALGQTVYFHNVKSVMDGKDFYDTYNNEEIFASDDVGQAGVSQYRPYINMVSTTNYKLDCANEKKKDTKYFTSELIIFTTNNFMNLGGFTKADCIMEPEALFRRGYVFDFYSCKGVNGRVVGELKLKSYSLKDKKFVIGPGDDVLQYISDNELDLEPTFMIHEDTNRIEYLKWMKEWTQTLKAVRASQVTSFKLTAEEKRFLAYKGQSLGSPQSPECGLLEWCWSVLAEEVSNLSKASVIGFGLLVGVVALISCRSRLNNVKDKYQYVAQVSPSLITSIKNRSSGLPTSISIVEKQSVSVELQFPDCNMDSCGLLSGRYLILPSHVAPEVGESTIITCYRGDGPTINVLVDKLRCATVYKDKKADVAIMSLPPSMPGLFKDLSKHIKVEQYPKRKLVANNLWFVSKWGSVPLEGALKDYSFDFLYKYRSYENKVVDKDILHYDIQGAGICGSHIVDSVNGILGMHVAGSEVTQAGAAMLWGPKTKEAIRSILSDNYFGMEADFKEMPGASCIKLDMDLGVHTSNKSSLTKTPLYGVLETTRSPANLNLYGPHTVKDIAKKSFVPVKEVPLDELDFVQKYWHEKLPSFKSITWSEVVKGKDNLSGLNKDSSNGFGCIKGKEAYVDFLNGCLTEFGQNEVERVMADITNEKFNYSDWIWTECLKDEVRNDEKLGKPRSFRISPVHLQLIAKKLFGDLVAKTVSQRKKNRIMVGTNPFIEWDGIYEELSECDLVWDGDIGSYDGYMLTQVQQLLADTIVSKMEFDSGRAYEPIIASVILYNMFSTLVAINDDVVQTSHSMPSGHFLTAIFNSWVNRSYTLMWYYRYTKRANKTPSISEFDRVVIDFVYGDDKLNGIKKDVGYLDALSMQDFFESIGMTFTDASKGKIERRSWGLNEVGFLKRSFVYHSKIKRVMCPLSLRTLYSGLSWYDRKKDLKEVLEGKLHTFQREMYLHEGVEFTDVVQMVINRAKTLGIPFVHLTEKELLRIYTDPKELLSLPFYGECGV